jgi:uncharacterized protein YjaG (DUF416 family)
MSILHYDEKGLVGQLERLPDRLRVAFAAACAQRQVPSYFRFSKAAGQGNPDLLVRAVNCLWDDLEGKPASEGQLQQQLDSCMSLLPDPQQDYDGLAYYAEDAVSAAAYAIRARLEFNVQEAVWAAEMAYNALDEFVGAEPAGGVDFDQEEEERRRSHPLVQAELRRQRDDLAQLQKIAAGSISERVGVEELRRRAQADATGFFGQGAE